MADYAAAHMDECCLVFDRITRLNDDFGLSQYNKSGLFHAEARLQELIAEYCPELAQEPNTPQIDSEIGFVEE